MSKKWEVYVLSGILLDDEASTWDHIMGVYASVREAKRSGNFYAHCPEGLSWRKAMKGLWEVDYPCPGVMIFEIERFKLGAGAFKRIERALKEAAYIQAKKQETEESHSSLYDLAFGMDKTK